MQPARLIYILKACRNDKISFPVTVTSNEQKLSKQWLMFARVFHSHLLHVVIQSYDGQRDSQACIGCYGGSHWRCFTDVAMVTGLQEVGCLVVFIQNFDLEVGESWQGVAVVLFCLRGEKEKKESCWFAQDDSESELKPLILLLWSYSESMHHRMNVG